MAIATDGESRELDSPTTEEDAEEDACRWFHSFKGHGSPRRSKKVVLYGDPDVYNRVREKELQTSLKEARHARASQRLRIGRLARNKQLVKISDAARASQILHFSRISNNAFQIPAILIQRNPLKWYTLWVGFEPIASFTDGGEAFLSANALKALNYDAYVQLTP